MPVADEDIVPVFKVYRTQDEQVFKDTLVVRSMIELYESKRTDTCSLYGLLTEYYHSQLRDTVTNPRPKTWPADHYLTLSFFKSEQEWNAYFEGVRLRGKPSPTNPEAGLPAHIYREAHLKHEKWKLIKAEILNHTHVEWVKMFPSGRMKSGDADIMVYVERLRVTLFRKWELQETSKTSKIVYKVWGWIIELWGLGWRVGFGILFTDTVHRDNRSWPISFRSRLGSCGFKLVLLQARIAGISLTYQVYKK
jgi:hypothetical protein